VRRSDRELKSREEIESILSHADVCRIAINTGEAPYIVPLNFGYDWDQELYIYFHGAQEGRKHSLIANDNRVGFEIDIHHELVEKESACDWGMKYKSIIGFGIIEDMQDDKSKKHGLDCIMGQYGYKGDATYSDGAIKNIKVFKLIVKEISGKARK
jgi:hypothetical protein